jgi:hypothetical protein
MRVRPTHYTIWAFGLQSWVVEVSLDGGDWAEIDRHAGSRDFLPRTTRSFTVSTPVDCRFIRLTQTGNREDGTDVLTLTSVEFFGTLSE